MGTDAEVVWREVASIVTKEVTLRRTPFSYTISMPRSVVSYWTRQKASHIAELVTFDCNVMSRCWSRYIVALLHLTTLKTSRCKSAFYLPLSTDYTPTAR